MLSVAIRQVREDKVDQLRAWMDELNRRQDEVRQTFAQEGVRHEQAFLLEGRDGPVLVYAVEVDDEDLARDAFLNSQLPIDQEHQRVMREVLAGPADAELLYECRAAS